MIITTNLIDQSTTGSELNRVWIVSVPGSSLNKDFLVFRTINTTTLGLQVFINALFRFRRGDRVMVATTVPIMRFIVALASLFRGAVFSLLIPDSYPTAEIAIDSMKGKSWKVALGDFFDRYLYKYANKVLVVSHDTQQLVERKSKGLGINIDIVPNWTEFTRTDAASVYKRVFE